MRRLHVRLASTATDRAAGEAVRTARTTGTRTTTTTSWRMRLRVIPD